MSRPGTRAKNASQHPGHILLEGKQNRRTSKQKQLDDALAEQELREKEAACEQGIIRLAKIVDQSAQDEGSWIVANPLKPRPHPRVVSKPADHSVEPKGPSTNPAIAGT